ncbi:6334_t:CDS:1, partial [Racocetra fulgida]
MCMFLTVRSSKLSLRQDFIYLATVLTDVGLCSNVVIKNSEDFCSSDIYHL